MGNYLNFPSLLIMIISSVYRASYQFTVQAAEMGNTQAIATATVIVTVLDTNDNRPQFDQPPGYSFSLPENLPAGTSVGRVMATDNDEGDNAKVRNFVISTLQ